MTHPRAFLAQYLRPGAQAEDGGAVDAPGHLARVDGGAPVVTIPARQARAFRVIDNRTSELTSWNTDLLPDALSGLSDLDIFSFDDVLPLAVTAGKTDPDDIPETPKNPVTRTGNLLSALAGLPESRGVGPTLRCGPAAAVAGSTVLAAAMTSTTPGARVWARHVDREGYAERTLS